MHLQQLLVDVADDVHYARIPRRHGNFTLRSKPMITIDITDLSELNSPTMPSVLPVHRAEGDTAHGIHSPNSREQ